MFRGRVQPIWAQILTHTVYFIYPETANVRLEEMNALFGDATTAMGTPATNADTTSLFGGRGSPVPSFSLGQHGADSAIPGLDIDPPDVRLEDGKPMFSASADHSEGVGGWITKLVKRAKGATDDDKQNSGNYKAVGQNDS